MISAEPAVWSASAGIFPKVNSQNKLILSSQWGWNFLAVFWVLRSGSWGARSAWLDQPAPAGYPGILRVWSSKLENDSV